MNGCHSVAAALPIGSIISQSPALQRSSSPALQLSIKIQIPIQIAHILTLTLTLTITKSPMLPSVCVSAWSSRASSSGSLLAAECVRRRVGASASVSAAVSVCSAHSLQYALCTMHLLHCRLCSLHTVLTVLTAALGAPVCQASWLAGRAHSRPLSCTLRGGLSAALVARLTVLGGGPELSGLPPLSGNHAGRARHHTASLPQPGDRPSSRSARSPVATTTLRLGARRPDWRD